MNDLFTNLGPKILIDNENEIGLDISEGIRKIIDSVMNELKIIRESILESIDVSNINYVKSKRELDSLNNEVSILNESINSAKKKVEMNFNCSKGTSEIEEVSAIKKEMELLIKANEFFETVSQLHSIFAEFDNYLVEYEFDLAADALNNANQKLNSIDIYYSKYTNKEFESNFSKNFEADKEVFEEVRIEYLLRKGRLISIVEKLFRHIFHFERNKIKIRLTFPKKLLLDVAGFEDNLTFNGLARSFLDSNEGEELGISLQDIWYALHSVGVVSEHVAYFSKQCIDNILNQLVTKGIKLASDRSYDYKLTSAETRSHSESTWEYKVIPISSDDGNRKDLLTVYEHIVPIIISLLRFISEDCFTGNIQVISQFGKCTWSWISLRLLQGISPAPSIKDSQILRDLEVQSRSLQIISSEEDTITNYINRLETSRYEERKINALSCVKEYIVRDDPSIVLVDDSTEIGSLTNLLQQCGVNNSKEDKANDFSSMISLIGGDVFESIPTDPFSSIQCENESFLQLPMCGVSTCAHLLVQRIHHILDEAIADSQKHSASAKQGYYLVRELVMLFVLLRPTVHKEKLENDPLFIATFYTDCKYLIHHLILIPFTYSTKFPPPLPQMGSFVDLLLTLRKLQETAISNLLDKEIAGISRMLLESALSINSIKNMSSDKVFTESETTYFEIVQRLKQLSFMFSSTLPLQVYLQCFAHIVDETVRITLRQILEVAASDEVLNIQPEDASALVLLLSSISSQLQKLFECHIFRVNNKDTQSNSINNSKLIYTDPPSLVGFLNHWDSLIVLKDVLDADIATIVQQKSKLKSCFQSNEIRGILNLNPFLSSNVDEIYYIILSSD